MRGEGSREHWAQPTVGTDAGFVRVILCGWQGHHLARKIVQDVALSGIIVVCWGTILHDVGAREFMRGFCDTLSGALQGLVGERPDALPFKDAFVAGCEAFTASGHKWGDPHYHLHKGGAADPWCKPTNSLCPRCKPPVHGVALFLSKNENGDLLWFCPEPSALVHPGGTAVLEGGEHVFPLNELDWLNLPEQRAMDGPPMAVGASNASKSSGRKKTGKLLRKLLASWKIKTVKMSAFTDPRCSCVILVKVLVMSFCLLCAFALLYAVVYYAPRRAP